MAHNRGRSVNSLKHQSISTSAPSVEELSDLNKYDDELACRLANGLKLNDQLISAKSFAKGKQKEVITDIQDVSGRRKLAMNAANAASNNLTKLTKSGWKAKDELSMKGFPLDKVLSMVLCFRHAIYTLRETSPRSVDVERSVSSVIGKLVTLQLVRSQD